VNRRDRASHPGHGFARRTSAHIRAYWASGTHPRNVESVVAIWISQSPTASPACASRMRITGTFAVAT